MARYAYGTPLLLCLALTAFASSAASASISASPAATAAAPRPNLLIFMADDLGWYDTSIYNPVAPTPTIKNLSDAGLRLDHHYVFRYCSPTRRSLLSGRFPNHITTVQPDGSNLCSDFLPLNATILSEKLHAVNCGCTCRVHGCAHRKVASTLHLSHLKLSFLTFAPSTFNLQPSTRTPPQTRATSSGRVISAMRRWITSL